MIPYGKQAIDQADIDAVVDVLKSDFLTQGPAVPRFEKSLVDYTGARHAVAVNSATSALHIACLALGLGEGDWLWTTPVTFVASANCGRYCGAKVDFVDIDPHTYNLCPRALEEKLALAAEENRLPKIVVPVHLSGQACDMVAIRRLAEHYDFRIIEDASHAIGGRYRGEPIGNCRYSDVTVFSFHPVKIVTTAEGGAALTNDSAVAAKMARYRSHGITREQEFMTEAKHGGWYYEQVELGFNYRMTDLQAALGCSQMARLDQFVDARHALRARYNQLLSVLPVTLPAQIKDAYTASHLYIIRLRLEAISLSHAQVFELLRERGIGVNVHYIPLYRQPYYRSPAFARQTYPCAEAYYAEAISLPMYHSMSREQLHKVVDTLCEILM